MFVVIDHAIGDGVGLLTAFLSLLDDGEEAGDDAAAGAVRSPSSTAAVTSSQKARKKPTTPLRLSHRAWAFATGTYDGVFRTLEPQADVPATSSLLIPKDEVRGACPGKSVAIQTGAIDLSDLKANVKDRLDGTTVNDILMALIAMGLRKTLEDNRDDAVLDAFRRGEGRIRGDFPVNMRKAQGNDKAETPAGGNSSNNHGDGGDNDGVPPPLSLNNTFCLASFPFPLNYEDPIDCVWKCKVKVDELKLSPAFAIRHYLTKLLLGNAPDYVLAQKTLEAMNNSTIMISNVIGPSGGPDGSGASCAIGGYAIDDLVFTTAYMGGMYVGVISFQNRLRFSVIVDRRIRKTTARAVCDNIEAAYRDLKDAVAFAVATKSAGCSSDKEGQAGSSTTLKMPIDRMTPTAAKLIEWTAVAAGVAAVVSVCFAVWGKKRT